MNSYGATSIYMPKLPLYSMKVFCNELLRWPLLFVVLTSIQKFPNKTYNKKVKPLLIKNEENLQRNPTRGAKQSSAALLGTEKPPWVLVSEAVKVLQNIWGVRLMVELPFPSSSPPNSLTSFPSAFSIENYKNPKKFLQHIILTKIINANSRRPKITMLQFSMVLSNKWWEWVTKRTIHNLFYHRV